MEAFRHLLLVSSQGRGSRRPGALVAVACSLQLLTSVASLSPVFASAPLPGVPAAADSGASMPEAPPSATQAAPPAPSPVPSAPEASSQAASNAGFDVEPVQVYTPDAPPENLMTPAAAPLAPAPVASAPIAPTAPSRSVPAVSAVGQKPPASAKDIQTWQKLEKAGEKAFYANEYGNAERAFNQAVALARTFTDGDTRLAKSSGELGRLLTVRGRFSEAEPLLEDELRIKILAFGNEDGKLIPDMASMVRFYLLYGTASKADPLTEKILSYVEGKLNEAGAETTGKVKFQAGQPLKGWAGEAAPVMRNPLIEWAIACDMVGNIYSSRKELPENFALADRLFKAALDVKSTVLGKQHLSLANSYDSLGGLCLQRHQDEMAESYFRDALEHTERILQPGDPQIYNRLDKLAKCLILEGKFADAEVLYQRAQSFWKEPSNNGSEARAMYALGNLYAQEKKYAEAAPLLTKALQAQEAYLGPDSVSLIPFLDRLAYVQYYLGNRTETDLLHERVKAIGPLPSAEPTLTMKAKPLDQ